MAIVENLDLGIQRDYWRLDMWVGGWVGGWLSE